MHSSFCVVGNGLNIDSTAIATAVRPSHNRHTIAAGIALIPFNLLSVFSIHHSMSNTLIIGLFLFIVKSLKPTKGNV